MNGITNNENHKEITPDTLSTLTSFIRYFRKTGQLHMDKIKKEETG